MAFPGFARLFFAEGHWCFKKQFLSLHVDIFISPCQWVNFSFNSTCLKWWPSGDLCSPVTVHLCLLPLEETSPAELGDSLLSKHVYLVLSFHGCLVGMVWSDLGRLHFSHLVQHKLVNTSLKEKSTFVFLFLQSDLFSTVTCFLCPLPWWVEIGMLH